LGQIVAPRADSLRDARAVAVYKRGDLLHAGARSSNHPHLAAPHDVREAEGHATDDRRAAVGPMSSSPRSTAIRLSARSSSMLTLSLNTMTCSPSCKALRASAAA